MFSNSFHTLFWFCAIFFFLQANYISDQMKNVPKVFPYVNNFDIYEILAMLWNFVRVGFFSAASFVLNTFKLLIVLTGHVGWSDQLLNQIENNWSIILLKTSDQLLRFFSKTFSRVNTGSPDRRWVSWSHSPASQHYHPEHYSVVRLWLVIGFYQIYLTSLTTNHQQVNLTS